MLRRSGWVLMVVATLAGACTSGSSDASRTTTTHRAVSTTIVAPTASPCGASCPPGPFTTKHLTPALTITLPDGGWHIGEDGPGEFKLDRVSDPLQELKFLAPPTPVRGGEPVTGVDPTPEGLTTWLRSNPDLVVTAPTSLVIAGGIEARWVEVSVAPSAKNDDPQCPDPPCVLFFKFDADMYHFDFGLTNHQTVRLLFAPVVTKFGDARTLLIIVDPGTPDRFDGLWALTAPILDSLKIEGS